MVELWTMQFPFGNFLLTKENTSTTFLDFIRICCDFVDPKLLPNTIIELWVQTKPQVAKVCESSYSFVRFKQQVINVFWESQSVGNSAAWCEPLLEEMKSLQWRQTSVFSLRALKKRQPHWPGLIWCSPGKKAVIFWAKESFAVGKVINDFVTTKV